MTEQHEQYYIRPSDAGVDVLTRLQAILDSTPMHSHVTKPLSRALVRAAAGEIARLRSENAALLALQRPSSSSEP